MATQIGALLRVLAMREALETARRLSAELQDIQGVPLIEKTRLQGISRALEPSENTLAQMERRALRLGWFVAEQEGGGHGDAVRSGGEGSQDQPVTE